MGKKKKAGHEHHGGAWKVAYSDFITSMMALFLVLWILSQNVDVQESIANYFLDPFGTVDKSPGLLSNSSNYHSQDTEKPPQTPTIDQAFLYELAKKFFERLNVEDDFDRPIDIQMTTDGLFITLFDRDDQPLFAQDSTEFTPWGNFVIQNLSWLIGDFAMAVRIGAHVPSGTENAWNLTTGMSNAIREGLTDYGMRESLINRITGYGSSQPIADPSFPTNSRRNQRVELELVIDGTDVPKQRATPVEI